MKRTLLHLSAACLLLPAPLSRAADLTAPEAERRFAMALQIARERNDKELVAEVETAGRRMKEAMRKGPVEGMDEKLRALETKVGIDPGGKSMAGQPLFAPTPEMLEALKPLRTKLIMAMQSDDPASVRAVTATMLRALGEQAGVPDGRRPGRKTEPAPIAEPAATQLFTDAVASEGRRIRPLMEGQPLPDQMLRLYGYVLAGTTSAHPFVARHQPDMLPKLDSLARGAATILLKLQQPAGHFPFPDLRGKNIRFGDMLDRQLQGDRIEVRDGWVISPDPDGGSQFDTGVCASALLEAATLHGNDEWKRAGLRAADWALIQPCCANFNYNAFSVSLLADAFRSTGDAKYLDGALKKFRVGVAPGQAPNGRWMDAHNARTVYHIIILRALADLRLALPAERTAERAELDQVTLPAIKALLDEFDAMGITVEALPELLSLAKAYPDDTRLRRAVQSMSASIVAKCTDGKQVKMGSQPHQLAAVAAAAMGATQ